MPHPDLIADAEAALQRLAEEELRVRHKLGEAEAEVRARRARLLAIGDERAAWTRRMLTTRTPEVVGEQPAPGG